MIMTGTWITLQEARDRSHGRIEWWKCKGTKGEVAVEEQQDPLGPPRDRPVRLYQNGTMYLGGWEEGEWHGFGVQYREDGEVQAWNFDKGRFYGPGMLLWLPTSPCWVENQCSRSAIQSTDGQGLPFVYIGNYKKGSKFDPLARVILKDGTSRVGPWNDGRPVGDWWEDHEKTETKQEHLAKLMSFGTQVSGRSTDWDPEKAIPQRCHSFAETPRRPNKVIDRKAPSRSISLSVEAQRRPSTTDSQNHPPSSAADAPRRYSTEFRRRGYSRSASLSTESTASVSDESSDSGDSYTSWYSGVTTQHDSSEYQSVRNCEDNSYQLSVITVWLAQEVIGYHANIEEMRAYAKKFVDDGFHSVEMIQDCCTASDLVGWMKKGHRRLVLSHAFKHDKEHRHQQLSSIAEWLERVIGYGADSVEIEGYARKLLDDGFHSIEMIQDVCTVDDIAGWMIMGHRRLFLARAQLRNAWEDTENGWL
jgi:hypothetical protein